jgi:hypothetical protein
VVLHVAQVPLQLGVLCAADKFAEDAWERLGGPLELDDLAGELVDAPADLSVAREDLSFYLVYVVLEARNDGGVVVDQPVRDGVEDRLWAQPQELGVASSRPRTLLSSDAWP